MEVQHERCCGIDVHKKTIVVCAIVPNSDGTGQPHREVRTFQTMSDDLKGLPTG